MRSFHRVIISLKGWQIFLITVLSMILIGYPLYLLGEHLLGWEMRFVDSAAPGIPILLSLGLWIDAVLAAGGKHNTRLVSPIVLFLIPTYAIWLDHSQDFVLVLPLFALAIAAIAFVFIPTAKAIHVIEGRKEAGLLLWLDTLLVGAFFPFGVWILQLRLNAALHFREIDLNQ